MAFDDAIEIPQDCTQYPHNAPMAPVVVNSADCAHTSGRVEKLLAELRSAGVLLSVVAEGLAFDAPADEMTPERLARLRADRDGVLSVLARFEERAAMIEHDGGRGRAEAERLAWAEVVLGERAQEPTTIVCPWCRSDRLLDGPEGVRCGRCDRLAWIEVDVSVVRADVADDDVEWIDPREVDPCPECGDLCDTMTAVGGWACSRCDPRRMQVTAACVGMRERILRR